MKVTTLITSVDGTLSSLNPWLWITDSPTGVGSVGRIDTFDSLYPYYRSLGGKSLLGSQVEIYDIPTHTTLLRELCLVETEGFGISANYSFLSIVQYGKSIGNFGWIFDFVMFLNVKFYWSLHRLSVLRQSLPNLFELLIVYPVTEVRDWKSWLVKIGKPIQGSWAKYSSFFFMRDYRVMVGRFFS